MSYESFPKPSSTIRPILVDKTIVAVVIQVKQTVQSGSTVAKPKWNDYIKGLKKEVGSVCDAIQTFAKQRTKINPTDTRDVKVAKLKQSEEIIKFLEETRDFVGKYFAQLLAHTTTEELEKCRKKMIETFKTFFSYFEK